MARASSSKPEPFNKNWEAEIAAYDAECESREEDWRRHFLVIRESGSTELTKEENVVFTLLLNGVSCAEIAKQCEVDVEIITGLIEVIRAKLSICD